MIVAICLDNNNGMMFNNRRQSRDSLLIDDLIKDCGTADILMNSYSVPLFEGKCSPIVDENFLINAKPGQYCFVENIDIYSSLKRIEKIIVYRWNRDYPSDMTFEIDLENNNFCLVKSEDFSGSSHDKITKETWVYQVEKEK